MHHFDRIQSNRGICLVDMILGCIVSVLLSAFGMHAYDVSHMPNKKESYTQPPAANAPHVFPDNINIYVDATHNYMHLKESEEETK